MSTEKTVLIYGDDQNLAWHEVEDGMEVCSISAEQLPKDANIVFDIDCPCLVYGSLETIGFISSRGELIVSGNIRSQETLYGKSSIATRYGCIRANKIYCEGNIKASGDLISETHIIAYDSIESAKGIIAAGTGISAGGHIHAAKSIGCTTRIFAGTALTKSSEDCDNIISCTRIDGSGTVAHGILIFHPKKR